MKDLNLKQIQDSINMMRDRRIKPVIDEDGNEGWVMRTNGQDYFIIDRPGPKLQAEIQAEELANCTPMPNPKTKKEARL